MSNRIRFVIAASRLDASSKRARSRLRGAFANWPIQMSPIFLGVGNVMENAAYLIWNTSKALPLIFTRRPPIAPPREVVTTGASNWCSPSISFICRGIRALGPLIGANVIVSPSNTVKLNPYQRPFFIPIQALTLNASGTCSSMPPSCWGIAANRSWMLSGKARERQIEFASTLPRCSQHVGERGGRLQRVCRRGEHRSGYNTKAARSALSAPAALGGDVWPDRGLGSSGICS